MTLMTFDIAFELGMGGFIGGWAFGNQRLQYWNLKNLQPWLFDKKITFKIQ
jgi:hypothetical protein